jgi:hypothetical protein
VHCLGLENSFFCRMTKLGERHLISSSSEVFKVTMTTLKGHNNEADFLGFLEKLVPHRSLTLPFEPFRFWLPIRGHIRNGKTTPRLGESATLRLRLKREKYLKKSMFIEIFFISIDTDMAMTKLGDLTVAFTKKCPVSPVTHIFPNSQGGKPCGGGVYCIEDKTALVLSSWGGGGGVMIQIPG